ncbi:TPA: hypothetical protein SL272_000862 [Pseudomonas aeruginosa]|nr:hypothetical protein [Pseudomonas aeruginosa]
MDKAAELIERYITITRTSNAPEANYQFTNGLIEMAYAIGDMSTTTYDGYLAQIKVAEQAGKLRKKAREIRFVAQQAERLSDARPELDHAAQLEREADDLDGTTVRRAEQEAARQLSAAARPKPIKAPEALRAEQVARGIAQIEDALGIKRHA